MEKLIEEFSIGLFFWQTVIFLLLIWLLKKYAWTPILNTINDREEGIKNALESAEKAREEIKTLKASNDKVLKEAKIERDNILKEASNLKKSILEEVKTEAKTEAQKIIDNANDCKITWVRLASRCLSSSRAPYTNNPIIRLTTDGINSNFFRTTIQYNL